MKLDLGSANNDSSFSSGFNNGFNSSTSTGANNLRWQVGVTWRPNPPEIIQVEGDKVKQRLDDNRSLMISLAEAISQNRTEMARGLAILLAPRLGYTDPRKLLAEMKEGASNIRPAPVEITKESTNINPPTIDRKEGLPNTIPPTIETPKGTINTNPVPVETPSSPPIELR
ncbi:hypothetical protein [Chamaesiphon sp. VAR_48_metabat_135_sub]|uniref:hypothetical protein n=1 Tax=Chamaesiphon sp. VAR_48_metabat_135_sub TaxID=2964699 RepID=UPI00286CAC08|nr:hypothetical protein [Chamaesiphon sp. VAR_48_metabat_135_sub]